MPILSRLLTFDPYTYEVWSWSVQEVYIFLRNWPEKKYKLVAVFDAALYSKLISILHLVYWRYILRLELIRAAVHGYWSQKKWQMAFMSAIYVVRLGTKYIYFWHLAQWICTSVKMIGSFMCLQVIVLWRGSRWLTRWPYYIFNQVQNW